jgi:hypothetical protein
LTLFCPCQLSALKCHAPKLVECLQAAYNMTSVISQHILIGIY